MDRLDFKEKKNKIGYSVSGINPSLSGIENYNNAHLVSRVTQRAETGLRVFLPKWIFMPRFPVLFLADSACIVHRASNSV